MLTVVSGDLCTEPYPESLSPVLGYNSLGLKTFTPLDSQEGRSDSVQIPAYKFVTLKSSIITQAFALVERGGCLTVMKLM